MVARGGAAKTERFLPTVPHDGQDGRGAVAQGTTKRIQHELVRRAQTGDHDAFSALAAAAVSRLQRTARLILRGRTERFRGSRIVQVMTVDTCTLF